MSLARSLSEPRELPDHCDPGNAKNLGAPALGYTRTEELAHGFVDPRIMLSGCWAETSGAKRFLAHLALVAGNSLAVVSGDVATLVDIEVRRWVRVVLAGRIGAVRRPEEHARGLNQSIRRRKLDCYSSNDSSTKKHIKVGHFLNI